MTLNFPGRFQFRSDDLLKACIQKEMVALKYVDSVGQPTMKYPMNPNGSVEAIAGLCSPDGRHLAMMPHPERGTLMWQWPYVHSEWQAQVTTSPWMCMFKNAYLWCLKEQLWSNWFKQGNFFMKHEFELAMDLK